MMLIKPKDSQTSMFLFFMFLVTVSSQFCLKFQLGYDGSQLVQIGQIPMAKGISDTEQSDGEGQSDRLNFSDFER